MRVSTNLCTSTIHAPGIIVDLPDLQEIKLQPKALAPVLLEENFTPFYNCTQTPTQSQWWEILELVSENHCASDINVMVLSEDADGDKWEAINEYFMSQSHYKVLINCIL